MVAKYTDAFDDPAPLPVPASPHARPPLVAILAACVLGLAIAGVFLGVVGAVAYFVFRFLTGV